MANPIAIFIVLLSFIGMISPTCASQVQLIAPGYGQLNYNLPEAGSYNLPVIAQAKDARVLNVNNEYVNFHQIFEGKYTLLSFIYTRCNDINGCPLAHFVYNNIQQQASKSPMIRNRLQLVSMSIDPTHDTPEMLKSISKSGGHDHDSMAPNHTAMMHEKSQTDWIYLTADSIESLQTILDDYDQTVNRKIETSDDQTSDFAHILRVYLIDPEKKVRNIYSVSFLHHNILLNDVTTLMLASGISPEKLIAEDTHTLTSLTTQKKYNVRIGPGDNKTGYESKQYQTASLALAARKGQPADLIKYVTVAPLGLPKIPTASNNPITSEKVTLGKKLFFDRRLSLNNTISCAMCHIPEQGFTSNELEKPVGFEGRSVKRNAPSLFNVAYLTSLFHDARETTLEHQVWHPILASNEMAMPSFGETIKKIQALDDYSGLFKLAFNGQPASITTIGQALASYQRTLVSGNSNFDRWYYGQRSDAISKQAQRGFKLFTGKAQCAICHTMNTKYALFTDNQLHNTGIGWQASMVDFESESVLIAPGVQMKVSSKVKEKVGNKLQSDLGYYEVTQNPADRWRYRTPGLRNVALTAPYMHDGSLGSLRQVIEFYNHGGFKNEVQSPLIRKLNLSAAEIDDIEAFLLTLTGDNVPQLVSDAFSVPVGDVVR